MTLTKSMTVKLGIGAVALSTLAIGLAAQQYPAPIAQLEADGVEIADSFEAPGGLKGYVGIYNGRPMEIYLTPDGDHALVGTMVNAQGEAVARDKLARASASGLDWSSFADTHWIAEGDLNAEKVVYVFTDPNCPFCAKFWEAAQPHLKKGGVQLRHIMVGMLREDSPAKAATFLAAEDPAAALAKHESTMQQGGVPADPAVPERFLKEVQENTRFMQDLGIRATPTVVFKDTNGQLQQIQGLPSESLMETQIFVR
ncbi:thiol:disulfide interchange protein DsbG [Gilvimarinus sp. F26214L]|uniref:thiol:disulfide interchange protein DsbG n=1 Tax=Gilvimarinus sp. DZF01 TaxID=3461371 RepID=UPI0040452142